MSEPLRIALGNGGVTLVDAADAWIATWTWTDDGHGYACRSIGVAPYKRKILKLHRVLLGLTDPHVQCDHLDGDGLNNQRANLRIVTNAQNAQNKGARGGTSTLRGVWRTPSGRFHAFAVLNQQTHHLDTHATEREAAQAAEAFRRTHMTHALPDPSLDPVGRCRCRECRQPAITFRDSRRRAGA